MRTLTIAMLAGAALLMMIAPVGAEEAKTPISAMAIMYLLNQPIEPRAAAFDRSLREAGPAPAPSVVGQLVDEGTVRYGRTTITVKNPCPPGTAHYEPPSLPGRRK